MMRIARFFLLFALLALFSPRVCISQSPPPLDASASAAGTVLLSGDDRPVPHADVELYLADSGTAVSTVTDDNGQFHFAQLSAATYIITVTAPDCELFQLITNLPAASPFVFRLRKSEASPTPRNNSVVSVQELAMPRKAVNAFQKGTQLLLKGDLEASLPYFRTVIELAPSTYRPYHNLGLALFRLGRLDAAAENFQKAIDRTNGGFSPSIFALSIILYQRADYRQAEFLIHRGLLVTPYSAVGKYCLGLVQFSLGRFDDAQRSALEAFSLDPHAADVHVLLARIYERQHNPSAVLSEAQTYLKERPNGPLEADAHTLLHNAQQNLSRLSASLN
jgi:tetratricopeptide (TPR) repeat protein